MKIGIELREIITVLLKGVVATYPSAAHYGRSIRRRLKKGNLSEFQILRHFSYHIMENDIKPENMIKECRDFLEDFSRNQWVLKTDDRFNFLPKDLSEYYRSGFDERNFICMTCYNIFNVDQKAGKAASCIPCQSEYNKLYSREIAKKKREEEEKLKLAPQKNAAPMPVSTPKIWDSIEAVDENPAPVTPEKEERGGEIAPGTMNALNDIFEYIKNQKEPTKDAAPEVKTPFVNIDDLTGGRSQVMLTISVGTSKLSELLKILDGYILDGDDEEKKTA